MLKKDEIMNLTTFLMVFSLVFLAELGDKTQLAVITLSSRYGWQSTLVGAMLAFIVIDGLSVLVGRAISEFIPITWIQIIGGLIFIAFGLYILLKGENEDENFRLIERRSAFISVLTLTSLAELGDKTQLAVITLAAEYSETLIVFLGVMFAFLTITIIGLIIGKGMVRLVPKRHVRFVSSTLFLIFGVAFLLQPLFT